MIQRLQKLFEDKTVQMTFMGGSVTEGYPYDERVRKPYPDILAKKLQKRYPDKNIRMRNLAGCGEQSTHGLLKCDVELDKMQKQIIFLEYALNDDASQTFVKVFESLLRKLIKMPAKPVVAVVILPSGKSKNTAVGEYMRRICRYYQLLCFDVSQYVDREIEEGHLRWDKYSFDLVHPGQWGHELIADFILKEMNEDIEDTSLSGKTYKIPSKSYFCSPYENMRVIQPEDVVFPMSIEEECSAVWLSYIKHNEGYMGTLQVYVDGEFLCNLHGKSFYCWKYPAQIRLFENDRREKHTITFQMAPGERRKKFIIEYIGIC